MTKSKVSLALLSSVSTAAAIFLIPATAQAQATACSQTGPTITCVDGTTTVLTATTDAATSTTSGPGLVTSNTTTPSTTTYVATGPIATTAVPAVSLTSTAGALTFTPTGTGTPVNISTIGGTAANALTVNAAGQTATVTVGNISTTGTSSLGVMSNSGAAILRIGNITTTGAGSQGASITATGTANVAVGNVATTSNGVTINAAANPVTLTTGTVTATELGATATVINSTGAVSFTGGKQTANGANALTIAGGAGIINATVNGAATTGTGTAVAITGTGPLTFVNTGSITTTGATSNGINISGVTTASVTCGNVSTTGPNSPAVVVAANGTTNVTCGTVTTTGAASDGIIVRNTAGTTTVTGGTTSATGAGSAGIIVLSSAPAATGLVTVNSGTVTANGNAVVGRSFGGANVIVNATGNITSTTGTGIIAGTSGTTQVTINAGTTTTGVQGVSLQGVAGNTLIVNGTLSNSTSTTPYTVLNGGPFTLTLGAAGTIVGPLVFTTGDDTFNNQGTFALPLALDFLAGTDVLNNTGTLTAFNGTSLISNLETFNNAGGLIDMRDGAANDVVNLANSNYVATGNARLGIDVVGTSGVNTADRLIIGGTTTGVTSVLANVLNPVIDTSGALIVDSSLNNLTAGQFVLSGPTNFGLINYAIQVRSGDAFIVSAVDSRIYDTVFVGRQARDLWYSSADAYNSYATARRVSFGQERSHPLGIWAQLYGERQTTGDLSRNTTVFGSALTVNDEIRTDFRGAQGGLDFGSANFVVGITGGYERARSTTVNGTAISTEGHNYGAYAQFGMTTGFYAGALVKRDDYRTLLTNGGFANGYATPRSHSTGAEGEIGFRTGGSDTINFDFGVGFAYVRTNMDTFNFGNISFTENKMTSERGQAHVRATYAGSLAPFIEVRGFHEFRDNNSYLVRSGLATSTLDGSNKGTWARIEAGIGGGTQGGPLVSAWANVGDTTGFGLRAGFRF